MRIQHNITALNAYRNLTNNNSAVAKNLEKLSSGYRINRAGDDAAGLAISEKMRAQITGLETAQKNANDGISLVQTAEGALTEVHSMLNRMVELATQSANGTYDNETDRQQLQKEVDQLMSEIDRIADSSNFNGIKLLDGSMATDAAKITGDARIIPDVYTSGNAASMSGTKTFLDGEVATPAVATEFKVDFKGLTAKDADVTGGTPAKAAVKDKHVFKVTSDGNFVVGDKIGGLEVVADTATPTATQIKLGDANDSAKLATAIKGTLTSTEYDITVEGDEIIYTAKTAGAIGSDANEDGSQAPGTAATAPGVNATDNAGTGAASGAVTITEDATKKVNGADAEDAVPGTSTEGVEFTFTIGGTEFKADANAVGTAGKLEDGGTEKNIAATVVAALNAAATAAGTDTASAAGGATVNINGNNYSFTDNGDGTITFKLEDTPTEKNIAANFDWDVKGLGNDSFDGNHTAGVNVITPGSAYKDAPVANTVFKLETNDIKDGTKITIDGTTVTLAVGKNSAYKNNLTNGATVPATAGGSGYIDLTMMEEGSIDLDQAISKISEGFQNGTTNFIVGVNDTLNDDTHKGLTVHKKDTSTETYDTKAKLAGVFEIEKEAGQGLTLQIGDTSDTYNQLKVSITDAHAASLGISGVDISTQDGAAAAVDKIKAAINKVSDIRGTLGATQNRLEHTINNLSVQTENITAAESRIRDVDMAEEMMAYTKNNILVQAAQAMLAQANQVPQGVLQLLQ